MVTKNGHSLVLKQMKNLKCRGTGGFTAEFYIFFWYDRGVIVCESLDKANTKGHLSHTEMGHYYSNT